MWTQLWNSDPDGFVYHERSQRNWIVRYGILLAMVALFGTTLQNLLSFEAGSAVESVFWSIGLAANLAAFHIWASSKWYPRFPLIDLLLMLPMIYWMSGIRLSMQPEFSDAGWSPTAFVTGNHVLGAAFGSLFFLANARLYIIFLSIYVIDYGIILYDVTPDPRMALYGWGAFLPIALIGIHYTWNMERKSFINFHLNRTLQAEKNKAETMLYSILPEDVAERLRKGEAVADSFSSTAVIFIDLVGSSELARSLSPKHFLSTLNDVFSIADHATAEFKIERVKTIGDAYLAVAGGRTGGDAVSALRFALSVTSQIQALAADRDLALNVRTGIHCGPVVGGVIGQKAATYDYWGDTMNVAARVESVAAPGSISVTQQTYFATRHKINYLPPRLATLKGIGEVKVYDVLMPDSAR